MILGIPKLLIRLCFLSEIVSGVWGAVCQNPGTGWANTFAVLMQWDTFQSNPLAAIELCCLYKHIQVCVCLSQGILEHTKITLK